MLLKSDTIYPKKCLESFGLLLAWSTCVPRKVWTDMYFISCLEEFQSCRSILTPRPQNETLRLLTFWFEIVLKRLTPFYTHTHTQRSSLKNVKGKKPLLLTWSKGFCWPDLKDIPAFTKFRNHIFGRNLEAGWEIFWNHLISHELGKIS